MANELYRVVFSGRIKEGLPVEEVQQRLSATFKLPPERIRAIFTGRPTTIKSGIPRPLAQRYVRAFAAAGAVCELLPLEGPGESPSPVMPPAPAPEPPRPSVSTAEVAGFWRRLFAFLADTVLLGLLGLFLGGFFFATFVRMGQAGRLVGFAIAILYFGLLNSAIGNGQTLGKRLMKIRVIDAGSGGPIPLRRSTWRYLVLGLPFFCNNLVLPFNSVWVGLPLALVVFGMGGLTVYLYLCNRRSRQTLHDLAAGTLVVRAAPTVAPPAVCLWRGHLVVCGLWVALVAGGVLFGVPRLARTGPFPALVALQQTLLKTPGVDTAQVNSGVTYLNGEKSSWTAVTASVLDPGMMDETTADRLARATLLGYPGVMRQDRLTVRIVYGYDIGISTSWRNIHFSYPPGRWAAKLKMISL